MWCWNIVEKYSTNYSKDNTKKGKERHNLYPINTNASHKKILEKQWEYSKKGTLVTLSYPDTVMRHTRGFATYSVLRTKIHLNQASCPRMTERSFSDVLLMEAHLSKADLSISSINPCRSCMSLSVWITLPRPSTRSVLKTNQYSFFVK